MKSLHLFVISVIAISIFSCGDIFTPTKKIDGPYFLSKNEMNNRWTLYYDLGGGSGHGRVDSINRIGWTKKYIFAEHDDRYYFIDKTKDHDVLNANEIVVGPFGHDAFLAMLDTLRIVDFKFQVHLEK